jgi:phosphomannomutase
VGEAHVVAEMRSRQAIVGGEGNGGVIVPEVHYGRDSLVAVALVAQALAASGLGIRALADRLPRLFMVKAKSDRPDEPWERAAERLRRVFPGFEVEDRDGIRLSSGDDWVHIRPSGTEPVVRVIAESPSESRTEGLVATARQALLGATQ